VRGKGELVYPNGKRISIECEIEVLVSIYEEEPFPPLISGRAWVPGNQDFAIALVGKTGVLEVAGRRMSMFIADRDGLIARTSGVLEGFPWLKA